MSEERPSYRKKLVKAFENLFNVISGSFVPSNVNCSIKLFKADRVGIYPRGRDTLMQTNRMKYFEIAYFIRILNILVFE